MINKFKIVAGSVEVGAQKAHFPSLAPLHPHRTPYTLLHTLTSQHAPHTHTQKG